MLRATANTQKILGKLQAQIDRLHNFSTPLQAAGVIVRDAAVRKFRDNDWAPDAASTISQKGSSRPGIDTGRLRQSIQVSPPSPTEVTIGTNVRYARWFQEGTGIFAGHTEWTVRPKSKKALAFTIGGVTYVRRSVVMKGQPAREFLVIDDPQRAKIAKVFERWVMTGAV